MPTLNLGILAHIDAGKTSLTERLLYSAGVIDRIGRVDDGSTQTDSLALERQRGITIKSAVVSFAVGDTTVNLIDTPGHPDFIAEVERVLSVLDGAVLVVSAVEGVQAQTRVLMRTLRRLRIPTLIFVNKIDRRGAQYEALLRSMAEKLTPAVVAMTSVARAGTREASAEPFGAADPAFTSRLVDLLAERDDALLAHYVENEAAVGHARLRAELAAQTGRALVSPVYFGSAVTGAGTDALIGGIRGLLPPAAGDADGPVSGTVFKVERGAAGEKLAYVRMRSGTVRLRDHVPLGSGGTAEGGASDEARITGIEVFADASASRSNAVAAGQIGRLGGLGAVRIGDRIGESAGAVAADGHFAPPTLETVVVPCRASDKAALHLALSQLAEQDPLIDLRQDDVRREISVSLYGEVQKEVIQATLAADFGLDVTFRETTTICLERPVGTGEAVEIIDKDPNPFLATVGLRVEPVPVGSGVEFRLGVELGSMPSAFIKAVEETVYATLGQGVHGWQVTDCTVTMTHSGYWARQSHAHGTFDKSMSSTAGDFRSLTPLVLMSALMRAGTRVYEPLHGFHLEIPADTFGTVLPALARLGAVPHEPSLRGTTCTLTGEVPAASVHELGQRVPGLTRGEGMLESAFESYREVRGPVPDRERTDHDPRDRRAYLLRIGRTLDRSTG
ncbi:ribosomal protection tetracycline resistance protein [Murinocardiopsis flavida]|uniref:Ribosomal protection tetracycline resistance protein n=1 Tax=Murinocardiopsis flavida TaxID=645275 RepID=A0A2P8DII1_9ACTN|nr:TetM/TetW/TetO/TetS family tetracycline resistance ribosomal protection protein [Murinocardiopsis flavida]PSK97011.1 ribosomal protection tetracycline resistance protein [Murinocardiopsis flavida]